MNSELISPAAYRILHMHYIVVFMYFVNCKEIKRLIVGNKQEKYVIQMRKAFLNN